MKILFTGGSSFTGYWFIRELVSAGHEVVATFRPTDAAAYGEGMRRSRVEGLVEICRPIFDCRFGDERFIDVIKDHRNWDFLCHHGAEAADYKSPQFDATGAVVSNTRNLATVLDALENRGCGKVLLTGSLFEGGEGAGSNSLVHFSPYGLSKSLTAQTFRYYCEMARMRLGKFVIPNPFGPFEEPRFMCHLMRSWFEGVEASVNMPAYIRDNMHISLLAKVYVQFAEILRDEPGFDKINPSGYVETQGSFAQRTAEAMRPRLGLPCAYTLKPQTQFDEPRIRINTEDVDSTALGWDEEHAWDELAAYYREAVGSIAAPR